MYTNFVFECNNVSPKLSFFMISSNIFFPGCKFSSIGPIYYEYGSMVLTFDNSKASVQAYELLRNSYYEEKKLLGKHSIY